MKPTKEEPKENNVIYSIILAVVILAILILVATFMIATDQIEKDYLSKLTPEERQDLIEIEQAKLVESQQRADRSLEFLTKPIEVPFFIMMTIVVIFLWAVLTSRRGW